LTKNNNLDNKLTSKKLKTTTVYEIITIQKYRYLMKDNNRIDSSKKNLHNLDKKNRKKYRIIKTNKFTIKMVNSNKLQ
jgi:hypothetical protein